MGQTQTAKDWNLRVSDVDADDTGCARFIVNSDITHKNDDDSELAAKVMEAAPDLLAALGECVSEPGAKCWDDPEIAYRRLRAINDIARAAIARAEGR